MKLIRGLGVFVLLTALVSSTARADSVVVTPAQGAPPAAAPVQPVAPVAVQPVQPVQPVEVAPRKTVVAETRPSNYMSTIAVSALMGALLGGLVGGAIYLLDDDRNDPEHIAYWAAGGVLVGTGVGLVNVMVQESRADMAVARRNADPVPTFRLALFKATF